MTAVLRRYNRGRKLVSVTDAIAGTKSVYHFDHQGSTQCLTDATTGAVTARFSSDAWGVPVLRSGVSTSDLWYLGDTNTTSDPQSNLCHSPGGDFRVADARLLSKYSGPHLAPIYSMFPGTAAEPKRELETSEYHVRFLDDRFHDPSIGPQFLPGECGAAYWRVTLRIYNRSGKQPSPVNPSQEVCGWIVQEVKLQGEIRDCTTGKVLDEQTACLPRNEFTYYEGWQVKILDSAYRQGAVTPFTLEDTFRWAMPGAFVSGHWRFSGNAVFYEKPCPPKIPGNNFGISVPKPDGAKWDTGKKPLPLGEFCENFRTTGLLSRTKPDGFDKAGVLRATRSMEARWSCRPCERRCVVDSCSFKYSHRPGSLDRSCVPR